MRTISNTSKKKCVHCGGQRRFFGWGNTRAKAREQAHKHDKRHSEVV